MKKIVVDKKTKNPFVVTSSFKFPGEGKMFCLENKNDKIFVKESELKKRFILASSPTADYFSELNKIKESVLSRVNDINQAIRYSEARVSSLDKATPEYEKVSSDLEKYKQDLKYYQDILEDVKDKIVDFQSLQSRITQERDIDLQQLYSEIGLDPNSVEHKEEVELVSDNSTPEDSETLEVTEEE
ncbi:MAG: hypothetical protein NC222_06610 [Staphylococcus sp.]|nr:hypothetical protein [Staphylococcus sp.]